MDRRRFLGSTLGIGFTIAVSPTYAAATTFVATVSTGPSDTRWRLDMLGRLNAIRTRYNLSPLRIAAGNGGGPVERLVSACNVPRGRSTKSMLSDKNLKEKGFSKFVKEGDGRYRKTV